LRATSSGGVGATVTSAVTEGVAGTFYYRPIYSSSVSGCNLIDGTEAIVSVGEATLTTTLSNNDFVWYGSTSSDWSTTSNWRQWGGSTYTVPSGFPNSNSANVIFPTTGGCVVNGARINASTVSVDNLTIESGHTFTLNSASSVLSITGSLINNGTWSTPTSGSTVIFNGSGSQIIPALTYSNLQTATGGTKTLAGTTNVSGVLTIGTSTTLSLGSNTLNLSYNGTPIVLSGGVVSTGTSTINYSGSGSQDIVDLQTDYYNLVTSAGGTKTVSSSLIVGGGLTIGSSTTLDCSNYDLEVREDFTNNGSFSTSGNVTLSGTNQSIQGSSATTFENLLIMGSGGTTTVNQDINVNQILYVDVAKTLNGGNPEITLNGSDNPLLLDGTFDAGTGMVTYTSSAPTNLAPINYYNLKANGGGELTLINPVTVSNQLIMSGGNIISSDVNVLEIGTSKTNPGSISWTTGTITGPLKRWFGTSPNSTQASGIFPVGTSQFNRYAQINFTE
jgi:hypothetical protein